LPAVKEMANLSCSCYIEKFISITYPSKLGTRYLGRNMHTHRDTWR
jgi:hypothetical protein